MTSRPVSATTVAVYLRRRQRATVAGLMAMTPIAVLVAVLGAATIALQSSLFSLVALAWPVMMIGRVAVRLFDDHRRVHQARALLDQPGVICTTRGHLLHVSAGDAHVRVELEHSGALAPPRRALPPARALFRGRS